MKGRSWPAKVVLDNAVEEPGPGQWLGANVAAPLATLAERCG